MNGYKLLTDFEKQVEMLPTTYLTTIIILDIDWITKCWWQDNFLSILACLGC